MWRQIVIVTIQPNDLYKAGGGGFLSGENEW